MRRIMRMAATFFLLLCTHMLWSQAIVEQSLHIGWGGGPYATTGPFNGCGRVLNAGWQKTRKAKNQRLNLGMTWATYNNECVDNGSIADFRAITARGIYNFDFVQSDKFAAFIGGGTVLNYTFGNVISEGSTPPGVTQPDLPRKERQLHPGFAANIGLRWVPIDYRLGFEIVPINVQFGFGQYTELFFQLRFFYSLDAREVKKTDRL